MPLFMDGRTLVSIVLNRRGIDFSERDRERLDLLRPHLAFCTGRPAWPLCPQRLRRRL
ncbi:hypothetical protein LP414_25905 [Polaromonas sp. P1(28)-13]|nr:hypothetical protein LP414_25905 [Polaromonas sp. P1(28)-13]